MAATENEGRESHSPLEVMRSAYKAAMNLEDDDLLAVDCVMGCVVANLHPQMFERVWLYLVSPPGTGKTELILPYATLAKFVFVSSLTENGLISGYRDEEGNDPSLINQLNGKILVFKDLTAVLKDDKKRASKLYGDLRDAFDGTCSKVSGTVGLTTYNSKFGVIACVTNYIDSVSDINQQLGERFITFRMHRRKSKPQDVMDFLMYVLGSSGDKDRWRTTLRVTAGDQLTRTMDRILADPTPPTMTEDQNRMIAAMAYLLSTLRTTPPDATPVDAEMGTRVMQQLRNIGMGRIIADGRTEWTEEDTQFIRRVVIDTLPLIKRRIVWSVYHPSGETRVVQTKDIATLVGIPQAMVQSALDQYEHTGVIGSTGKGADKNYMLLPEFLNVLNYTKLFEPGSHMPPVGRKKGAVE